MTDLHAIAMRLLLAGEIAICVAFGAVVLVGIFSIHRHHGGHR